MLVSSPSIQTLSIADLFLRFINSNRGIDRRIFEARLDLSDYLDTILFMTGDKPDMTLIHSGIITGNIWNPGYLARLCAYYHAMIAVNHPQIAENIKTTYENTTPVVSDGDITPAGCEENAINNAYHYASLLLDNDKFIDVDKIYGTCSATKIWTLDDLNKMLCIMVQAVPNMMVGLTKV